MTFPDRAVLAFLVGIPHDRVATSEDWFACGDRERAAGEPLAALAAYGRAAEVALAETKSRAAMTALDAWLEQAQLWAERGQADELARLAERMIHFAVSFRGQARPGELLRVRVFAHFVTEAAMGKAEPLSNLALNVRAVRLGDPLPRASAYREASLRDLDHFNERQSFLWGLKS